MKALALAGAIALALTMPAQAHGYKFYPKPPKPPKASVGGGHSSNPWPAFVIIGWGSCVVGRAVYVNHTQNRELSKDEVAQCMFPLGYLLRPLMGN